MADNPYAESYRNALFYGHYWDIQSAYGGALSSVVLQVYFPQTEAQAREAGANDSFPYFAPLSAAEVAHVQWFLGQVASFANLTFQTVTNPVNALPQLYLYKRDLGANTTSGLGELPIPALFSNPDKQAFAVIDAGPGANIPNADYANHVLSHEILHTLGLKHPWDASTNFYPNGPTGQIVSGAHSTAYTLMAYDEPYARADVNGDGVAYDALPIASASVFDIAALQQAYGANFSTRATDTVYAFANLTSAADPLRVSITANGAALFNDNIPYYAIWDGGGVDTYDFSAIATNADIDLRPGAFSRSLTINFALGATPGHFSNAFQVNGDPRSLIEHAIGGTGADAMTGNAIRNYLFGGDGADVINAGEGDDVVRGGAGADSLTGGAGADVFYFRAADLRPGVVDTVLDPGATDLVRIDGVSYASLSISTVGGRARVAANYSGAETAYIDIAATAGSSVAVATSGSLADPLSVTAAQRAGLQFTTFDWGGTQPYARFTDLYNGAGQRDRQVGVYDGTNGSWDFLYDVTNAQPTYATRFDYFNAAGQKTQQVGTYDAPISGAASYVISYDPAGTQPFTTTTAYFNAGGQAIQTQSFYDVGGSGITNFDPDNLYAYSSYTTYYDALGRADTSNGTYDGTAGTWWVDFDQTDAYAWTSLTVLYDQAGAVTQQWYSMPDGPIVYL